MQQPVELDPVKHAPKIVRSEVQTKQSDIGPHLGFKKMFDVIIIKF